MKSIGSFFTSLMLCAVCEAQVSKVIDVPVPNEIWPGWQSGVIDEDPHPTPPATVEYETFPTPVGEKAMFSGRVEGVDASMDGVEVGLVKVFAHEYCQSNAMDLTMLRDDGTFAMSPTTADDRPRTLCVRAPGHPWAYLRHDFPPGASGKNIVLRIEPGKKILVHAQLRDGPSKTWMMVEAFDGYQRRDDHQAPVHSEYYGGHQSDEGSAYIMLPLRPMALRVRADNSASGCVIIDPRQVDEVTIRLPKEGRINVHVVKGSHDLPQKTVWLFNPCQRLSWMGIETGTDARFDLEGLMPGQYRCFVDDHVFTVAVGEGATTEARFDLSDKSQPPQPLQEALDVPRLQPFCWLSDATVAYDR